MKYVVHKTENNELGTRLMAQSVISTKRTSVMSKQGGGGHSNKQHNASQSSQDPPHNILFEMAIPRRLSVSASVAGEEGLYSCVLPQDLLVEIIADRFQVSFL